MNAYKLADKIDITKNEKITKWSLLNASVMLRKQQDEIKTLKKFIAKNNALDTYTQPKDLTDDEIVNIGTKFLAPKNCDIYTFARAILKKAQK